MITLHMIACTSGDAFQISCWTSIVCMTRLLKSSQELFTLGDLMEHRLLQSRCASPTYNWSYFIHQFLGVACSSVPFSDMMFQWPSIYGGGYPVNPNDNKAQLHTSSCHAWDLPNHPAIPIRPHATRQGAAGTKGTAPDSSWKSSGHDLVMDCPCHFMMGKWRIALLFSPSRCSDHTHTYTIIYLEFIKTPAAADEQNPSSVHMVDWLCFKCLIVPMGAGFFAHQLLVNHSKDQAFYWAGVLSIQTHVFNA